MCKINSLHGQRAPQLCPCRKQELPAPAADLGGSGSRLEQPGLFPQAASHDAGDFHRLLQVPAL